MTKPIKYKETGLEWCPQIPEHWELKKLKYVVTLRNEVVDESDFTIAVENIESGTGLLIGVDNTKELSGTLNHFYKDDILFNKLRPYLHKVYFATKEGGAYGELLIIKSDTSIIPKFLFYKLFSKSFINVVNGFTQGSKMPRATWDGFINLLSIAYPKNKKEQEKIADYLDRKTNLIDSIISKKEKQIELYKEERTAVINQAVTKGLNPDVEMKDSDIEWLGSIPKHWYINPIKYLINITNGDGIKSESILPTGSFPVYGGNGILGYTDSANYEGDHIIIGRVGAKCGNVRLISGSKWISDNAMMAIVKDGHLFKYIMYLLDSLNLNKYANKNAQPLITGTEIKNIIVAIPKNIAEQQQIVTYLDKETNRIDTLISKTSKQITLLKEYKEALINEVVTGQRIIH